MMIIMICMRKVPCSSMLNTTAYSHDHYHYMIGAYCLSLIMKIDGEDEASPVTGDILQLYLWSKEDGQNDPLPNLAKAAKTRKLDRRNIVLLLFCEYIRKLSTPLQLAFIYFRTPCPHFCGS